MMKINEQIAELRKAKGLTQEQLAELLGISNQAVSKWESGLNCPDIALIPELAKILGVSVSELFGDAEKKQENDIVTDEKSDIRIVVMKGNTIIREHAFTESMRKGLEQLIITLKGNCHNLECVGNAVIQGDVLENATAGDALTCVNVGGNVNAGDGVTCGNVGGSINAGDAVQCGDITGSVHAGDSVSCGDVGGDITCGDGVTVTGDVKGNISCGDGVEIYKQ